MRTRRIDRADVIVALPKLNIGLVKEVTALQECLENNNVTCSVVMNNSTLSFLHQMISVNVGRPSKVIFYNISPVSIALTLILRAIGCTVIQCFHEPGMDNKLNYGARLALKIVAVEVLVFFAQTFSSESVVFSQQAAAVFRRKFKFEPHLVPLCPYAGDVVDFKEAKQDHIIFVGKIHPAKNFPLFLQLAERLSEQCIEFSIITREIPEKYRQRVYKNGAIKIIEGHGIPDAVIEEHLGKAKLIFKLDKNMMQSGLVAQAAHFQCGCLVNNIEGFSQDIVEQVNGVIFDAASDSLDSLVKRIEDFFLEFESLQPMMLQLAREQQMDWRNGWKRICKVTEQKA